MANPIKGEVAIELIDGRKFTMLVDFGMRCAVEDLCDKPFPKVAEEASQGYSRAIRALVWGSLQYHHPDMTLDDVTELISRHEHEIDTALLKAIAAAAEDKGGKDGKNPPRARRGKNSGASGVSAA